MKKKMPLIVVAMLLVFSLFMAACGSTSSTEGQGETSNTEAATGSEDTEPAEETDEPADASVTRTYESVKGPVEIPAKPQRIVTDYYGGELLAVGANVIGVEPTAFDNPFIVDELKETGAVDVGTPVNTEKVLELEPDLIVVMYDDNYDALSKIAPTVHIPYGTGTNIQETVELFGDLVGAPEKAEEFLAEFDAKAAEGKAKLEGIVDENTTVGLYELTDSGELWIFGDNAGRGGQAVYNALGLKLPEAKQDDAQTEQISLEVIPDYAADYMFLTTYDPENKGEQLPKLQESAVWSKLEPVKNNLVFFNDFDTWYRYDPIASLEQIDMVVDMLVQRAEENK